MNNNQSELIVLLKESGLSEPKQSNIAEALSCFFTKASEWGATIDSIAITSPDEVGKMKTAREARLAISKYRLDGLRIVTEKRAVVKSRMADDVLEDKLLLKAGQILEITCKHLENKAAEKENFAEVFEANRKSELKQVRESELITYAEFVPLGTDLGNMSEEAYMQLFNNCKTLLQVRKDAELKAENDRVELLRIEAESREKLRLENEALKAENDAKDKAMKEQKELAELAQKAAENEARKEREELQSKAEIEADKAAEVLRLERKASDILKAELQAKAKIEADAKADSEAAIELDASKGDADKFQDFINDLVNLQTKYTFKSQKFKDAYILGGDLLNKTVNFLISKQ